MVLLGTIIFCLGLKYVLAKPFYQLSVRSVKQLNIIMDDNADEDEKDALILKNLVGLLKMFFYVIFLLILLLVFAMLPSFVYQTFKPDSVVDTSSILFYGSMFLGSFVVLFLKDKADYSYWSKLLHTIILDNYQVGKYFFSRDIKKIDHHSLKEDKSFVIVSGLARAGTTALARMIYDPSIFHSTKYSNMPFILAPKLWKRFYNPRKSKEKQRAHGDNVMHSETSIEAMEEYFFKVFLNDNYINQDSLSKHEIDHPTYLEYLKFQELFRDKAETTFLAKNNNLILRLRSLREYNKNFKVVLMFRKPEDHARSLLNQHLNFVKQQAADPFTLKYMDWLCHHEFGLSQKHFDLSLNVAFEKYPKKEISFWLLTWFNYYEYLLSLLPDKNIILVEYEDLLSQPNRLKRQLADKLEIDLNEEEVKSFTSASYTNKREDQDQLDESMKQKISTLYENLRSQKLKI